jgi:hypothetical protein
MDSQDTVGIWIGDYCGAQHMAIRLHDRGCHNVTGFERPAEGGSLEVKEDSKKRNQISISALLVIARLGCGRERRCTATAKAVARPKSDRTTRTA